MIKRDNPEILRKIAEECFSLTSICPQYRGMGPGMGNCFCVFHTHTWSTPSAKLYWDDDKDILVLHCFQEHRTYTSYDYINLILVREKEEYKSVEEYLIKNLGEQKFNEYYTLVEQTGLLTDENFQEQTIEYINNVASAHEKVTDFINALYLEKD